MDSENDNVELFRRWGSGDGYAGSRFVAQWSPWIRRTLFRKLGRDVDDVLQETLLALHASTARFRGSSDRELRSFVLSIALHRLCAELRKRRKFESRTDFLDDHRHLPMSDAADDSDDDVSHRLRVEAWNRLPPETQHLLRLAHSDNFARRELARILDIPEGTVSRRLQRARRLAKQILAELQREQGMSQTDRVWRSSATVASGFPVITDRGQLKEAG
jgi:RNA polymerase sigma-70 factor (ECF subfamily)